MQQIQSSSFALEKVVYCYVVVVCSEEGAKGVQRSQNNPRVGFLRVRLFLFLGIVSFAHPFDNDLVGHFLVHNYVVIGANERISGEVPLEEQSGQLNRLGLPLTTIIIIVVATVLLVLLLLDVVCYLRFHWGFLYCLRHSCGKGHAPAKPVADDAKSRCVRATSDDSGQQKWGRLRYLLEERDNKPLFWAAQPLRDAL
ncbi:hypothetical protein HPB51_012161 [Rhipicephalus microplus]|uniref:Uncharacterized protein n=1 Tax=Rhipicephalus microplus TaxID=6941 RepID=A0A9J6DMX8_RHIMP|nr:hypothetical protein HPB51_012161 [Rhipicephalus microplus]